MKEEIIGRARLILGDCREILPGLSKVDAVVTDPPYGIGFSYESYEDSRENLINLISNFVPICLGKSTRMAIMCGVSQIHLYPEPVWTCCITWNTTGSYGKCGYTQWMPVLFYGEDLAGFGNIEGLVTKSDVFRISGGAGVGFQREKNDHPCPKPENMMKWAVARFSGKGETALDPFMGSGTTGVAAVQMERNFIGIEHEPKYFDIACKRIEDAQRQGSLFGEVA